MRAFALFFYALYVGTVWCQELEYHESTDSYNEPLEEDLTVWLNHRNFTGFTEDNRLLLLAFVDKGCPFCKELMVELVWTANQVAYKYDPIPIAKVDVHRSPSLAKKFKIDATPALFIIEEGVPRSWMGKTDAHSMSAMMKTAADLMVNHLTSVEEVASFMKKHKHAIIGTFDEFSGDTYSAFKIAARGGEAMFGAVKNANTEVLDYFNLAPNTLELFSHRKPLNEKYLTPKKKAASTSTSETDGAAEAAAAAAGVTPPLPVPPSRVTYADGLMDVPDAIETFILHHKLPYVTDLSLSTVKTLFRSPFTRHVMLFVDPKPAKGGGKAGQAARERLGRLLTDFHTVAQQYERASSSDAKFALLSVRDEYVRSNMMPYYGVLEEHAPLLMTAVIDSVRGTLKYKMDVVEDTGFVSVESFVKRSLATPDLAGAGADAAEGGLKPWPQFYRSQEVPDADFGEDMEEYVKRLVGSTFEKEVLDGQKDVLVLFHAPWCPHCQALHPVWDNVAEALFHTSPTLVTAKLDATLNEIADFDVPGFPMIVMFPASATRLSDGLEFSAMGYKVPDYYNIVLFAKETATHPVKLQPRDEDSVRDYVASQLKEEEKTGGKDEL